MKTMKDHVIILDDMPIFCFDSTPNDMPIFAQGMCYLLEENDSYPFFGVALLNIVIASTSKSCGFSQFQSFYDYPSK